MQKLPRDAQNDYTRDMATATARRHIVTAETGAELTHTSRFSIDAAGQNMVSKASRKPWGSSKHSIFDAIK